MASWRTNRQTISWFIDLHKRGLLDRDPPYQRRSVWNRTYKRDFIETVLLDYPSPTLFLHEEMSASGAARQAVVDGKQRLTSIIEFVEDEFTTSDAKETQLPSHLQGVYFSQLGAADRKHFFEYELTVEYVPSTEGSFLNEVFDRLNRNVAKLSRQELRHARYSGVWASTAEDLAEELFSTLGPGFPRISNAARLQMKDVEYTVQLMVLVESGPSSVTQDGIDEIYADRDEEWNASTLQLAFRKTLRATLRITEADPELLATRFRNQVDFYSLFGAIREIEAEGLKIDYPASAAALIAFGERVDDMAKLDNPDHDDDVGRYHFATRSAANNVGSRRTRIEVLRSVLVAD